MSGAPLTARPTAGSPAGLAVLAGQSGQARALALGFLARAPAFRAAGSGWLRRTAPGLAGAGGREVAHRCALRRSLAHAGAGGRSRRASSVRCGRSGVSTMQAGPRRAEVATSQRPECLPLPICPWAGTTRPSWSLRASTMAGRTAAHSYRSPNRRGLQMVGVAVLGDTERPPLRVCGGVSLARFAGSGYVPGAPG
jgi:hypothetical protein